MQLNSFEQRVIQVQLDGKAKDRTHFLLFKNLYQEAFNSQQYKRCHAGIIATLYDFFKSFKNQLLSAQQISNITDESKISLSKIILLSEFFFLSTTITINYYKLSYYFSKYPIRIYQPIYNVYPTHH
ncbi:hypothetical protein J5751_01190 [bacterium]|nr:hypothetical protein [bacterium]